MSEPGSAIFGQTKVSTNIADPSDITGVVKEATSLAGALKAIAGDVVQLTNNIPNYRLGGFYQFRDHTWVDVGEAEDLGFTHGSGTIRIEPTSDGSYLFLSWSDPVGPDGCDWIKSEIVILDADRAGEQVILVSDRQNAYKTSEYKLSLMVSADHLEGKTFIVRSWFENDGFVDGLLNRL